MQREREGRDLPRNAERAHHAAVVGFFCQLAAEEEKRIRYLPGLLNALEGEVATPAEKLEGQRGFSQRAAAEMLDQTLIESMIPGITVCRTAYLIEQDLSFSRWPPTRPRARQKTP